MKKALLVTTVSGFIPQFEMENVSLLQEIGYEVHYASNFQNPHYGEDNKRLDGTGMIRHQIDFVRSPYKIWKNIKAYRQLKRVMEQEAFELLHCHTPMGAVLARLAAHSANKKKKSIFVIYTAHGFHFYKKAPLKNWFLYYPVEKWLSGFTDILITINEEDYYRARYFCRKKHTEVKMLPGVGIDTDYWGMKEFGTDKRNQVRSETRESLGIAEQSIAYLSIGELSKRKNHQIIIEALALMKKLGTLPKDSCYFIAGQGELFEKLKQQIQKAGLENQIFLLGYRQDVRALLNAADIFVFPSRQEGMPVALLEAAASGLPLISGDIRGNREIIRDAGGILVRGNGKKVWADALRVGLEMRKCGNRQDKMVRYSSLEIKCRMMQIYREAGNVG